MLYIVPVVEIIHTYFTAEPENGAFALQLMHVAVTCQFFFQSGSQFGLIIPGLLGNALLLVKAVLTT